MRAEPLKTAKVLAQIPYQTELEAEYVSSEWSKVTYKGRVGYVMAEFLAATQPISKNELQQIYNSLKQTLQTIENILK